MSKDIMSTDLMSMDKMSTDQMPTFVQVGQNVDDDFYLVIQSVR